MNRFDVDDILIWTSPHTGDKTEVVYRGEINGWAMIFSGWLQIQVPFDQLTPMPREAAQ